jgi:phosphoadenosine phosphosulfate reductase
MESTVEIDPNLINQLNAMGPEALLAWAFETHGDRAGIISSFQDTGCAMIDMASGVAPELRVLTVDTLRLHSETYALMDKIEARYGIEVERFTPDPDRLRKMINQHGLYLFFDSEPKQEYCCQVRKVEPNVRALRTVDVWITGLRRDHSNLRSDTSKATVVQEEWGPIIKLAPLAEWDSARVLKYNEAHNVPINPLYAQGYTSIGCAVCSTPTLPWEDKRAGRWRWFNATSDDDKECGIHTQGSGI